MQICKLTHPIGPTAAAAAAGSMRKWNIPEYKFV